MHRDTQIKLTNHFVLTIHSSHAWMGRLLSTCCFRRFGAKSTSNKQEKQVVISETLIAYSQWEYSQTAEYFCDCLNLWFRDGEDKVCWSLPVWYPSYQCKSCLKIEYILKTLEMYSTHASSAINTSIPTQLLKLNFLSAKCCRSWHSSKQTISIFWQTSCNYHWLCCCCFGTSDCWRTMFPKQCSEFFFALFLWKGQWATVKLV